MGKNQLGNEDVDGRILNILEPNELRQSVARALFR
jgi:hypothetical protein